MAYGQTAVLRVKDTGGFLRIDLEPVPGKFWVFVPQHVSDRWERTNWHPHISMTYATHNKQDSSIFERIVQRWDGKTECIKVEDITRNGTLVVKQGEGVGNDWGIWRHYIYGTWGDRWTKSNFGLHISM